MSTKFTNITIFAVIALALIVGFFVYPYLPDQIASHWNAVGEVNGHMSKFWGIFLLPLIMIVIFFLYFLIPKIDPLRKNIDSFRNYYNGFWVFLSIFLFYIFHLTLAWNLGQRFNFTTAITPAIAILYYLIGIMLGKSKRNWFVGIRTPWTLSNDAVWEQTNKLGGKLFKLAAILSLAGLLFRNDITAIFLIAPVIVVAIVTVFYSYFEYKKCKMS